MKDLFGLGVCTCLESFCFIGRLRDWLTLDMMGGGLRCASGSFIKVVSSSLMGAFRMCRQSQDRTSSTCPVFSGCSNTQWSNILGAPGPLDHYSP